MQQSLDEFTARVRDWMRGGSDPAMEQYAEMMRGAGQMATAARVTRVVQIELPTAPATTMQQVEPFTPKQFTSRREMYQWLDEHFAEWRTTLTTQEKRWIQDYGGSYYRAINATLRGTKLDPDERFTLTKRQVKRAIQNLDSAVAKGKIPKNITLYRGIGENDLSKYVVGDVKSDAAFLSTSLDEVEAIDFANQSVDYGYKHKVLLEIHVRNEHSAAQVFGGLQEYEVLLPKATQLKIVAKKQEGELLRVIAELL